MPTATPKASLEPQEKVQARKLRRLAILLEMASEGLKLYEDESESLGIPVPCPMQKAHALIRETAKGLRQTADETALLVELEAVNP